MPMPSTDIPVASPMPGSAGAMTGLPALGGGPQAPVGPSPDIRSQLQNITQQLPGMHSAIDDVVQQVQGIVTQFPGDSALPQQITQTAGDLKKLLTSFVMETIKQAPRAPQPAGPIAMR